MITTRTLPLTLTIAVAALTPTVGLTAKRPASYAEHAQAPAFIRQMSVTHGFAPEDIRQALRHAYPLPKVLRAIAPPTDPRVRSWQRYRARYIEPGRIAGGLRFWSDYEASLRDAETRYGVPAEVVVAIIGVETIYGRYTGDFQTLSALATLAFDYPPRAELFRHELEELFLLARESHRSPIDYRGSYAGAVGLPQFLPSSIRKYAIDFDGDQRIDLAGSPRDAIGSVARFLAEHGWEPNGTVAVPARTNGASVRALVDAGILPTLTPAMLAEAGVEAATPNVPAGEAALIDLITPDAETEYWLGYRNFYVISRYNRSSFYAMAVYQLSRALREARDAGAGAR